MKSFRKIVLGSALLLAVPTITQAVAFKLKNDASFSVRARVYDQGQWRPWVQFNPGGWAVFGAKVQRTEHTVQLDKWTGSRWERVYQGNHGSRLFTRVVQILDGPDGAPLLAWWDERPGCRDMPPHPQQGGSSCLEPCGYPWRLVYKVARKIGEAYVAGK